MLKDWSCYDLEQIPLPQAGSQRRFCRRIVKRGVEIDYPTIQAQNPHLANIPFTSSVDKTLMELGYLVERPPEPDPDGPLQKDDSAFFAAQIYQRGPETTFEALSEEASLRYPQLARQPLTPGIKAFLLKALGYYELHEWENTRFDYKGELEAALELRQVLMLELKQDLFAHFKLETHPQKEMIWEMARGYTAGKDLQALHDYMAELIETGV